MFSTVLQKSSIINNPHRSAAQRSAQPARQGAPLGLSRGLQLHKGLRPRVAQT